MSVRVHRAMARWFMILGSILLALGALMHFAPGAVSWFGKLPGDINIETDNGRVFIPITSMIVVSIVLSIAVTVLTNLFKK